jgi:mono/diheme cytochrome c family protein
MMRKIIKWIAIVLGVLLALVVVAVGALYLSGSSRLNKTYELEPEAVSIPNDATAIGRGAYLYASTCAGCHGDNLGGTAFFDDPALGYIPASNLTSGAGGVGARYGDRDWVLALRHGVGFDGRALMVMPSKAFWHLSDEDLGAIIAYVKAASPVDNELGEKSMKPIGKILIAAGVMGDVLAAEVIDHNAPRPAAPQPGLTAAYGEYLVNTNDCRACHGAELNGGQPPEPGAPLSPNLTPGGDLANWSEEQFIQAIRSGITPDGRELDPHFMPWKEYARKTDEDLKAMFLYLQSLPALEAGK